MTTIRLYWNNICVLHRQELQFLNEIREELRKDNIDLDKLSMSPFLSRRAGASVSDMAAICPTI